MDASTSQQRASEGFQRAIGKPFGRLRRGETLRETKKQGFPLPLLSPKNLLWMHPPRSKGTPKVSKGRSESPLVASAEAKPSGKQKSKGSPFPCYPPKIYYGCIHPAAKGPRRFPKGDRKALWPPPQRRNPALKRKRFSPQKDIVKALTARSQGFCNYFPLSSSAFTLGTSAISVALRGGNSGFISVSVSRRISLTR